MSTLLPQLLTAGVLALLVPQADILAGLSPGEGAVPGPDQERTQDPVQVRLTGITTMLSRQKAVLEIREPGRGNPMVKVIMGEGERLGAVEVLDIDVQKSTVQIRNGNLTTNLAFEPGAAPTSPPLPRIPEQNRAMETAAGSAGGEKAASSVEADEDEMFPPGLLKFQDADLFQVLEIYQELSGRTVLRPALLPQAKISLRSQTSLSRAEALQLLDSALGLNGIVLIPQGDKVIKAVPAPQAGQEAAPINATSPDELPESGTFVMQMVQLAHKQPKELVQALQPLAKNPQAIVGIDASKMLVLRDHSVNVKRMLELIDRLDVPPERHTPKQRSVFFLYVLAAVVGLVCSKAFLGWSFGLLWRVWGVGFGLGWIMFLHRFPRIAPDSVAGEAAAWGAFGAGVFLVLLAPFLVRLYCKWTGAELTEEEKTPGMAGVRAWLTPVNLLWAAGLSLFAWLGFGFSFLGMFVLAVLLLLAYPLCVSPWPQAVSEPPDAMTEDRRKVLKLLEGGVVTPRECVSLLNAIGRTGRAGAGMGWPAGPWQKLVAAGAALVLIGFFLPWFTPASKPDVVQAAAGAGLPALDSARAVTGGEIGGGLGWGTLILAMVAVLLPWLGDRWDLVSRRRLALFALGAGAVILLYLLTQNPAACGFGFFVVLVGYALEFLGTFREGAQGQPLNIKSLKDPPGPRSII